MTPISEILTLDYLDSIKSRVNDKDREQELEYNILNGVDKSVN